jgi:RNA polymerase sigma-70 factor, ECF subfamily
MLGPSFPEILTRAREGDQHAWTLLYDDLSGPLVGFLRGRGAPDPEDQVGETFLDIVRNLGSFAGDEAGFRAWVFTIAHRRLVDALRRRTRRPVAPVPTEHLVPLADALDQGPHLIDQLVERMAVTGHLEGLLAALSDDQREVLVLRFAADLDATTVGQITGRSTNAVAAITRRALLRLRELIDEATMSSAGVPSSAARSGPSGSSALSAPHAPTASPGAADRR